MKQVKKMLTITVMLMLSIIVISTTNVSAANKVKLNKTKATIYVGKTVNLKLKNNKKKVKWSTSKKKVATVSKKGKVKGKKAGKATITAKVGKKKYKCKVTVKSNKVYTHQRITQPYTKYTADEDNSSKENNNESNYINEQDTKIPDRADLVQYIRKEGVTDKNGYKYIYSDFNSEYTLDHAYVKVISDDVLEFYYQTTDKSTLGSKYSYVTVNFVTEEVLIYTVDTEVDYTYTGTSSGKMDDIGLRNFNFTITGTNYNEVKERLQGYFNWDIHRTMRKCDSLLKIDYRILKKAQIPDLKELGFVNWE